MSDHFNRFLTGAVVFGLLGAGTFVSCSITPGTSPAAQYSRNAPEAPGWMDEDPEPDTSEAGPDIKNPGPDFGSIPNGSGIVSPGRFYVESAAEFEHDGSSRSFRLPALLRAGVAEDWEIRAKTWAVQHNRDSTDRETGAGPVELGFKHRFTRGGESALSPAYSLEVMFRFPVSINDFDSGKIEPFASINVDHVLSPNGGLNWNIGMLMPVDEDDDQYLQGYLAGAYTHFVTPSIQLYATGSVNYPTASSGGGTISVLGAGGYWYVSQSIVLFLGYNAGLTSESPTGAAVAGASFAF